MLLCYTLIFLDASPPSSFPCHSSFINLVLTANLVFSIILPEVGTSLAHAVINNPTQEKDISAYTLGKHYREKNPAKPKGITIYKIFGGCKLTSPNMTQHNV